MQSTLLSISLSLSPRSTLLSFRTFKCNWTAESITVPHGPTQKVYIDIVVVFVVTTTVYCDWQEVPWQQQLFLDMIYCTGNRYKQKPIGETRF